MSVNNTESDDSPGLAGRPVVEGPVGDDEEANTSQGPEQPEGRLSASWGNIMGHRGV